MPRSREDRYQVICARPGCGKQFFQRRPGQVHCSRDCANKESPGTGGQKYASDLEPRTCANKECQKQFRPYRDNQRTCSRGCYSTLSEVRERDNAARRTPEVRERRNEVRRASERQQARVRTYNREHQLLSRYRLTVEGYEAMLAAQDGKCQICGSEPDPDGIRAASKLHVDHDHETGVVRDLLCLNCNRGLGYFRDDPVLLRAAAEYIERHRVTTP